MSYIKSAVSAMFWYIVVALVCTHLFMGVMWVIIGVTSGSFDVYGNEHLSILLNKQQANVLLRNVYNNLFAPDVSYLGLLTIWVKIGAAFGVALLFLSLFFPKRSSSTKKDNETNHMNFKYCRAYSWSHRENRLDITTKF